MYGGGSDAELLPLLLRQSVEAAVVVVMLAECCSLHTDHQAVQYQVAGVQVLVVALVGQGLAVALLGQLSHIPARLPHVPAVCGW
jgi:hypothetical protein